MKISLITPTYNSAATLRDTLDSVIAQAYSDLEYIIIDGASTDGTLEIIKQYQDRLKIKLVSEPDSGLYDAMNKGLKLASGEIIGIINSDDSYKSTEVLKKIAATFSNDTSLDGCYGDIEYISPNDKNKIVRFWRAGEYAPRKLNHGWTIPHPSFFARRKIYQENNFRTDLELAADYELLLRLLRIKKIKVTYLPETLVRMRAGGASGRNLSQRIKGWRELRQAWRLNNLPIPCLFITRRLLSKVSQFF